ncbi:MAG: flagellar filament capping protein FliD [Planctomycetota bacterium]
MLSVDGLISGLNTSSIIEQLLSLERRPLFVIGRQVEQARQKQTAFLDLSARLLNLQVTSSKLADKDTFRAVTTNSSDSEAMVASAQAGVPPGVYNFRIAQLARASQHTSGGFATADETNVGAGTLTLELGGGFVDVETELDELNGGNGVSRGSIRITDGSGATQVVDLSTAITLNDVITAINDTAGIDVTASVAGSADTFTGRGLVLVDNSGGAGNLSVQEVSAGTTATDLGILASASGTLQGTAIRTLGGAMSLATLGDGLGARLGAGDDLTITRKDGVILGVDLDSVTSLQGVLDAINNHTNNGDGLLVISTNSDADGFDVVDSTGGGGSLSIVDGALSTAATDLGIVGSDVGGTINGTRVLSGLNDVLLGTLNGGSGVSSGSIVITDRAGTSDTVNLSSAETLQDVVRAINDATPLVTATVNREGNGILVRDTSGGSSNLMIKESGGGSTAAELGILADVSATEFNGSDLQARYVHANARLADLNGGQGVADGKIRVIDSNGVVFTVELSEVTMGDVVQDIQGAATLAGSDVVVGYTTDGNGITLTSASGSGTLRVEEVSGGTTAKDLHIAGSAPTATPGFIDGAFEESITIAADDTLEDVQDAINALGINVTASILNDGSSSNPYRLNLVAGVSGRRGRLLVDTSAATSLSFNRTASARDGVVFYGESSAGSEAVLIRSRSNTYSDIVDGLTVTALQASSSEIQISVALDNVGLTEHVKEMVDKVNEILDEIHQLTNFNLETEQRGILLGDGTVRNLERRLLNSVTRPLRGAENSFSALSELGIRLRNGRLQFDSVQFDAALRENPEAVRTLFTAARALTDRIDLDDFNNGNGVDLSKNGSDLKISLRDGTDVEVDISTAVVAKDIVDLINAAGGGNVTAQISATQNSYILTDSTTGSNTFRVTSLNSSAAANNLGLNRSADVSGGGVLTGFEIDLSDDIGVAARITDLIEQLTNVDDGTLQSRADGLDTIIGNLEERIERFEERLVRREELLRRQFAQLEQLISASQGTLARLNAQFGALGRGA